MPRSRIVSGQDDASAVVLAVLGVGAHNPAGDLTEGKGGDDVGASRPDERVFRDHVPGHDRDDLWPHHTNSGAAAWPTPSATCYGPRRSTPSSPPRRATPRWPACGLCSSFITTRTRGTTWRQIAVEHPLRHEWREQRSMIPLIDRIQVPAYLGCD
jgi:hypothetical protein